MASFRLERVIDICHWNDKLFSFRTTRDPGFRFRNGQFIMLGLPGENRPVTRAYSIASANHEDHMEFFSIKVEDGKLTSRLQHIAPGDEVLVSAKPVGTLVIEDLNPGKRLFLLATGTGLAPFLSVIQDPETYEAFEHVYLVHGVRRVQDLAYREFIEHDLPHHEYLGELIDGRLHYYPTVTREPFAHQGRIPELMLSGRLCNDLDIMPLNAKQDRAMVCGNMNMLRDTSAALQQLGFEISPSQGVPGDFVIERAFVDS
ncbi:MAG: ferredoxin--NADP reductase [Gammaproteobacteria bacterium]|nr:ferredoxin--NADP reductase [Gammaproteobacteria bacterium]